MKKILCVVLSMIMLFSCFGVCITASAADYRYRPDGTKNPDGTFKPDLVGKVIDPILYGYNTTFSNGINSLGYASVDNYTGKLSDENFYEFITANGEDKMLGVELAYLYNNKESNFFWNNLKYELKLSDNDIHETEVKNAAANKKGSTCAAKGAYDACSEVIYGYEYDYDLKSTDKKIFESIVEEIETIKNPATKKDESHYNYYYKLDKGNFALVKANINSQIYNTISKKYADGAIYKDPETANYYVVKIANFIGNLLYPDFDEKPEGKYFTGTKNIKAEEFFRKVTELSGLESILDEYWCNTGEFDVKNIMSAFGVIVSEGAIFNLELEKGLYMGGRILTDIYRGFTKNPVDYTLTVLQKFCRNYSALYQKPIERLFEIKMPVMIYNSRETVNGAKKYPLLDSYTGYELNSVDGLLDYIADCIYVENVEDGVTEATCFEFAPLPMTKFATTSDITELYLYMLCYCDLNSIFENNSSKIDSFIINVSDGNNDTTVALNDMFKGGLSLPMIHAFYLGKLTANTVENFSDNFTSTIKKAIGGFLQNLLEAMENFMNLLFGWTDGLFGKE